MESLFSSLFFIINILGSSILDDKKSLELTLKTSCNWRRPTFPQSFPCSIMGSNRLNRRVRYGNGCSPKRYRHQMVIKKEFILSKPHMREKVQLNFLTRLNLRLSPRSISMSKLNTLLHLHLSPINLVFFKGSYQLTLWEISSQGRLHAQMLSAFILSKLSYPAVPLA